TWVDTTSMSSWSKAMSFIGSMVKTYEFSASPGRLVRSRRCTAQDGIGPDKGDSWGWHLARLSSRPSAARRESRDPYVDGPRPAREEQRRIEAIAVICPACWCGRP